MTTPYDAAAVEAALRLLHEPDSVFEIRIPQAGRAGTVSGYYSDPAQAAADIAHWDAKAPGIYHTINPVLPDLLARAHNRLQEHAKSTTSDSDIVCRLWLLVDIDPKRPSGISATSEELKAAGVVARQVQRYLRDRGWPEPVVVASGNGVHLLYRIDLPNDQEAVSLVQRCLRALAERFDTDAVHVDQTVHNAARISKVPGTLACKGDDLPDRPHRRSRILDTPTPLEVVSRSLLEALAADAGEETATTPAGNGSGFAFDVSAFLARHGLRVRREREHEKGALYELETCPFNADHDRGEAWVLQLHSGAIDAGCQHASCTWGWRELRERFEPREVRTDSSARKTRETESTAPLADRPVGVRLSTVRPERVSWLWPGRIPLGKLCILDGDPGLGKSTLTLDISARLTAGGDMPDAEGLGSPVGVLLITGEDGIADTVVPRLQAAGANLERVRAVDTVPDDDGGHPFVLPDDIGTLERVIRGDEARLVIIDPIMAFLGAQTNAHRDQDVRRVLARLHALAERTGAAVLLIRHLNKMAGGAAIYRGGGSIGLAGAARSVLLVARDPENEDGRILATVKCNLQKEAPSLSFRLESTPQDVARLVWQGTTEHRADTLLAAPASAEERTVRDEAKDFLSEYLSEGPRPTREVQTAAREAGINEATLRRARSDLGVVPRKQGFQGQWVWTLPPKMTTHPQRCSSSEGDHLCPEVVTFEDADAPFTTIGPHGQPAVML